MKSSRSQHKHENTDNCITNIYLLDEGDSQKWNLVDEVRKY